MKTVLNQPQPFHETVTVIDDQSWIWDLVQKVMGSLSHPHVKFPTSVSFRHNWERIKRSPFLIIQWEGKVRSGGAIIEELQEIDRSYDVSNRIIIITSNPIFEDVIYLSELKINRIVKVRAKDSDYEKNLLDLKNHVLSALNPSVNEDFLRRLEILPATPAESELKAIEDGIMQACAGDPKNARTLDLLGMIEKKRGNTAAAEKLWKEALDLNPQYNRSLNNLAHLYKDTDQLQASYLIFQKLQKINPANISRLVTMGEIQLKNGDVEKARHFFSSALERDKFCSGALNGLAEIHFMSDRLDEAREMLERSHLSYKYASKLNEQGINLVRAQKYEEALNLYTRAQYVLPSQEKGPALLYNIGLCYARWGKVDTAREFLRLALIKEPNYKRAEKLLESLAVKQNPPTAA